MNKSLEGYLTEKQPHQMIQGRIPVPLFNEVKEIQRKHKKKTGRDLTWTQMLTAALTWLRDSYQEKK